MNAWKWILIGAATGWMSTALAAPHNLILFVPDGLRAGIVDSTTAPAMARLRDEGVNFVNSHSLFPTFTTANASAFATGHGLGDTGDFGNAIYTRLSIQGSVTPFLESDTVLAELNAALGGNYLKRALDHRCRGGAACADFDRYRADRETRSRGYLRSHGPHGRRHAGSR